MSKQLGVVEQLGLALNALRLEVPAEVMDDVDLRFRAVITKLEAMEQKLRKYQLKERVSWLLSHPPQPHESTGSWQAWKEETDAAMAAAQEERQ